MRQTAYRVAGESLVVRVEDNWSAAAIDAFFERWYLTPDQRSSEATSTPAIVVRSEGPPPGMAAGLSGFDVAGGGTCYSDGTTSIIDMSGSLAVIGPAPGAVEVWIDRSQPLEAPSLTRVVTYALSAALRQRSRFELHSGALIDPENGKGVLIIGPSGSGKSTLTVHLASAGWPFLSDDVLLLSEVSGEVKAWPLRRFFAVTSKTVDASPVLRADALAAQFEVDEDGKQHFLPHSVFSTEFREYCVPDTLFFPELTGADRTHLSRLSRAETMTRLIRMNPWSCYDRSTAARHLAALSALAKQAAAYSLLAGRDLLDPEIAVMTIAATAREVAA